MALVISHKHELVQSITTANQTSEPCSYNGWVSTTWSHIGDTTSDMTTRWTRTCRDSSLPGCWQAALQCRRFGHTACCHWSPLWCRRSEPGGIQDRCQTAAGCRPPAQCKPLLFPPAQYKASLLLPVPHNPSVLPLTQHKSSLMPPVQVKPSVLYCF